MTQEEISTLKVLQSIPKDELNALERICLNELLKKSLGLPPDKSEKVPFPKYSKAADVIKLHNTSIKQIIDHMQDNADELTEIVVGYRFRGDEQVHVAWSAGMPRSMLVFMAKAIEVDVWENATEAK